MIPLTSQPSVARESTPGWINPKLANRIPELDGLRGLAILLVLILHYAFETAVIYLKGDWQHALLMFRLSWSGVDLFFVLSGFLIGGILIDAKDTGNYYSTFYLRRFYRIAPLYIILMLTFLIGEYGIGPNAAAPLKEMFNSDTVPFWAYPLFLQNILGTLHRSFGAGWMGPTWSLAVEEQFYLLLPFAIRRLSDKGLIKFTVGTILFAPALRMILTHLGVTNFANYTLLPCRGDSLGLGLFVAIACRNQHAWTWLSAHRKLIFAAFLILGFGLLVWTVRDVELGYTWTAAFYTSLLLLVVVKPGRIERGVFRNVVFVKFGTIAYGVYLFHVGVLRLYHYAFFGAYPSVQNWSTLFATILALFTVVTLAELSWRFFEKPLIMRGRLRYQYRTVVGPVNDPRHG